MTRIPHADMAEEMSKMVYAKRTWLRDHAAKRPAHEVTTRTRELEVLQQAQEDYERAANRQRGTS